MPDHQRAVPALVAATAVAALVAATVVVLTGSGFGSVAAVLSFACLAVAADVLGQRVYGATTVSLSAVAVMAAAAAGEPVAALVAAFAAGVAATAGAHSRRAEQYVFNPAALVLCAGMSVTLFSLAPAWGLPALVAAGLVAGVGYFAVDNGLVALVGGLDSGRRPEEVFRQDLSWLLPTFAAYGVLGAFLGSAWASARGWGVAAFLVPLLLVRLGQRRYVRRTQEQVEQMTAGAIELTAAKAAADSAAEVAARRLRQTAVALADAIDARDTRTGGRVERVAALGQVLMEEIAPELAADPQLSFGFLLHDVGTLGVPDAVLGKTGELTMAERAVIDTHPHLGWRIVEQAGFPPVVGELVLAHHERWDGTGYPRGLRDDEIPCAARVFAVVDAFAAMTSDRPYRRSLSVHAALSELQLGAGTQFDPAVVDAMLCLGADRLGTLLGGPDVITLPDSVPHQAGYAPIWSSTPA